MACVLSWLGNWSPEQRQRLVTTMGQLEAGPGEEDLLAGMRGLGLQRGNPASQDQGNIKVSLNSSRSSAGQCGDRGWCHSSLRGWDDGKIIPALFY